MHDVMTNASTDVSVSCQAGFIFVFTKLRSLVELLLVRDRWLLDHPAWEND